MIEIGREAPDLTLRDQNERQINLGDLRGKRVLLAFHPLAWTPVCAEQMLDLERHRAELDRLGAVALGIAETPLLADFWPHGEVARKFGIFREGEGFSERAVFILDEEGIVRFAKVYPLCEVPPFKEVLPALERL